MPKRASRLAAMTVSSREWTVTSGRAGIRAPTKDAFCSAVMSDGARRANNRKELHFDKGLDTYKEGGRWERKDRCERRRGGGDIV